MTKMRGAASSTDLTAGQMDSEDKRVEKAPYWSSEVSVRKGYRTKYLSRSTGNLHNMKSADHQRFNWCLPSMFGSEKYAYYVPDVTDKRYTTECANKGSELMAQEYDKQIIDLEWRRAYKQLLHYEHRRKTLPQNASEKVKSAHDEQVRNCKEYLLKLQQQKDAHNAQINEKYDRFSEIKKALEKEEFLDNLRTELTNRTRKRLPADDEFWSTPFNVSTQPASP